jgi:hypothetical protein
LYLQEAHDNPESVFEELHKLYFDVSSPDLPPLEEYFILLQSPPVPLGLPRNSHFLRSPCPRLTFPQQLSAQEDAELVRCAANISERLGRPVEDLHPYVLSAKTVTDAYPLIVKHAFHFLELAERRIDFLAGSRFVCCGRVSRR